MRSPRVASAGAPVLELPTEVAETRVAAAVVGSRQRERALERRRRGQNVLRVQVKPD